MLAVTLASAPCAAQETGSVSGEVFEADGSEPIPAATVRLGGTDHLDVTAADGSFEIPAIPVGAYVLIVQHTGFTTIAREVVIEPGALHLPLYLESVESVSMDAPEPPPPPLARRNVLLRADIEAAVARGLLFTDLLGQSLPSVRVRDDGISGAGVCVEYRGGVPGVGCRHLGLVVDGVRAPDPAYMFGVIDLADLDRIELLSPAEAGTRFGGVGGWGVLLIDTRRGPRRAETAPSDRLVSGFDWSDEPRPYPWARVLLSTAVANAAGLGISYYSNSCLGLSTKTRYVAIRSECDSWGTVGSVLLMAALPSLSSSLAARWAGGTERSHGRFGPSALIGTALTVSGYVALMYGDARDNRGASIAGVTILTVGTPLFMTLSDRVLRVLR